MGFERDYFEGQTFYGDSILTEEQQLLKADLEKLEKDMVQRKRQNFTAEENQEFFENRMFEIQQAFYLRNQQVAEELKQALEDKKKQYYINRKKNAVEDFVELQRLQLKYSALNDEELIKEAQGYIGEPNAEWGLDRLSVLNAELAKRGIDTINYAETFEGNLEQGSGPVQTKKFTEWIQERGGDRPWEAENPEIMKALRLYDNPYGEFSALTEDGAIIPNLEIQAAYVPPKDK